MVRVQNDGEQRGVSALHDSLLWMNQPQEGEGGVVVENWMINFFCFTSTTTTGGGLTEESFIISYHRSGGVA